MRDAIAWSNQLLTVDEQMLFRRLGVFTRGGTIEALKATVTATGLISMAGVEGLDVLVEASLIRTELSTDGTPRFSMLEVIREYALEQLRACGEEMSTREAHARYFLSQMESAEKGISGPEQRTWLERLEAEHDNLRAALDWIFQYGTIDERLLFAGSLTEFWLRRGHTSEGRRWLDRAVTESVEMRGSLRAQILLRAASFAVRQGDYSRARVLLEDSIEISIEIGDEDSLRNALNIFSEVLTRQNEPDLAMATLERCLELARVSGNPRAEAGTLNNIAHLYNRKGDTRKGRDYLVQSLELMKEIGDDANVALALGSIGIASAKLGDFERASRELEESLRLSRRLKYKRGSAFAITHLASLAAKLGDSERARCLYNEGIQLFREIDDQHNVARALINSSQIELDLKNSQEAQRRVEEARTIYGKSGNREAEAHAIVALGNFALDDELECACELYKQGLVMYREVDYAVGMIDTVRNLAEVIRLHAPERSARLFAAAEAARESLDHYAGDVLNEQRYREDSELMQSLLTEEQLREGWESGRLTSLEDAVADAVAIDCSSIPKEPTS
jgi:tetratricopeptide (TPR) repeat protein